MKTSETWCLRVKPTAFNDKITFQEDIGMKYIITGLLLSIGWHFVKLVYEVVSELLFSRLHEAKWYLIAAGKEPAVIEDKPGDIKEVKNRIGF